MNKFLKKYLFATLLISNTVISQEINPNNRVKTELNFVKKNIITNSSKMQSSQFNYTNSFEQTTSISYNISATKMKIAHAETKVIKIKNHTYGSMTKDLYYNSENPQSGDYKVAEQFSKTIGSISSYILDENAIVVEVINNTKDFKINNNDYSAIEKGRVFDVFLNIKQAQNIGNSWYDSTTTLDTKIVEKYTYKSYANGIATIEVNSTMTIKQKVEIEDDEILKEISLNLITISTLKVDIATLLIKKKNSTITSMFTMGSGDKEIITSNKMTTIETIE